MCAKSLKVLTLIVIIRNSQLKLNSTAGIHLLRECAVVHIYTQNRQNLRINATLKYLNLSNLMNLFYVSKKSPN